MVILLLCDLKGQGSCLRNNLSNYKGKVVYIDVFQTLASVGGRALGCPFLFFFVYIRKVVDTLFSEVNLYDLVSFSFAK